MPRRDATTFDIIGTDRGNVCTPSVNQDYRNTRIDQTGQIVGRWRHRENQQPFGAISTRQCGEVFVAVRRQLHVEQHEVVPAAVERSNDTPQSFSADACVKKGTTTPSV